MNSSNNQFITAKKRQLDHSEGKMHHMFENDIKMQPPNM